MEIPKHFQEAMIFKNYFFMVKSICVQPPLLARLASVSVWQRAVNRQPGYHSGNSKGRSPPAYIFQFSDFLKNFEKELHHFSTFSKSLDWIEL